MGELNLVVLIYNDIIIELNLVFLTYNDIIVELNLGSQCLDI